MQHTMPLKTGPYFSLFYSAKATIMDSLAKNGIPLRSIERFLPDDPEFRVLNEGIETS
jgi:hypothetical protein